ncbi:hypothetical protein M3M39_04990 [Fructilactobacillus hinvesii]|uniref:Uncharacterized protein n=1 Tax=Fructilactobacillus hinvesii TaxID=2940300 RepID=A0ABY5BR86_9LACO|nr:hypothetical protein [Fructilactobacillus hinvesii]USS87480.1 hypothetical protein M3M39_04990 [Fructilactobacillus hinvesii]
MLIIAIVLCVISLFVSFILWQTIKKQQRENLENIQDKQGKVRDLSKEIKTFLQTNEVTTIFDSTSYPQSKPIGYLIPAETYEWFMNPNLYQLEDQLRNQAHVDFLENSKNVWYYIKFVNNRNETLGYFHHEPDGYCYMYNVPTIYKDMKQALEDYQEDWLPILNKKQEGHAKLMAVQLIETGLVESLKDRNEEEE